MKDEYTGYWWLPSKPDSKIHGTLRLSEAGIVLGLDGTLGEFDAFVPSPFMPDIILGQTIEAARLTLYRCFQLQTGGSLSSGLTRSKIDAQTVLIGAYFNKPEGIKFEKIEISFPHLDEWVGISGFDIKRNESTTTLTYKLPTRISAIVDNLEISLDFSEEDQFDFPAKQALNSTPFYASKRQRNCLSIESTASHITCKTFYH